MSASPLPMGDLLQLRVTLSCVPCQGALESLDQQGFIVCILGHLPTVHLQVNHRVALPIVFLEFWDFEFGRHYHVGELGHAREVRVPKELRPCMS